MALTAGTKLGSYEVLAPLGAGGMGEVYRARDIRLGRDVAIKVLPDLFASDPERLARLEREAQLLATLNHPNIAQIYGLEEIAGQRVLSMELVDGHSLADRLSRGALPIRDALMLARQIAEALEAAHDKGIIHRDLKPANVMLTADDQVKVLDFGLAKSQSTDATAGGGWNRPGLAATQSPTIMSPAVTGVGVILGTAAYMAPEQAKGRAADKRSDVWAFGCVLYEMLCGKRPFEGDDISDTLAAVLRAEPDWPRLPSSTPMQIRRLLERCLQKDRAKRLTDLGVARLEIDDWLAGRLQTPSADDRRFAKWTRLLPWAVAVAAAAGTAWAILARPAPIARPMMRVSIASGSDQRLRNASLALSPDGTSVVLRPAGGGNLLIRRLDELIARELPGTDGGAYQFFSRDGQWLAFFAQGMLKKVPISGGAAINICPLAEFRAGAWGSNDIIVFGGANGPLRQVSASGNSTPVEITSLENREAAHKWPYFLPDGESFVFTSLNNVGNPDNGSIEVFNLATRVRKTVMPGGGFAARYGPGGNLVYLHDGTLFAVPFDAPTATVHGTPVPVAESVLWDESTGAAFDATQATIAYLAGERESTADTADPMLWLDSTGKASPVRAEVSPWKNPRFSNDGGYLAFTGQGSLWIRDLSKKKDFPLPQWGGNPLWTPDSRRVTFTSNRTLVPQGLYWMNADGSGAPQLLKESDRSVPVVAGSWHPEGHLLAFAEQRKDTGWDLFTLEMVGVGQDLRPGKVTPLLDDNSNSERSPAFSPRGDWIAYESNQSGSVEIWVKRANDRSPGQNVSRNGGSQPMWSLKSPELFFLRNGQVLSLRYSTGSAFLPEPPLEWSPTRAGRGAGSGGSPRYTDLHPDGKRFVIAPNVAPTPIDHINLIQNFPGAGARP